MFVDFVDKVGLDLLVLLPEVLFVDDHVFDGTFDAERFNRHLGTEKLDHVVHTLFAGEDAFAVDFDGTGAADAVAAASAVAETAVVFPLDAVEDIEDDFFGSDLHLNFLIVDPRTTT